MRTFSTVSALSLLVAGALSSAGCLQKEVTHTIYISPSAVTWSTLEKDVRSDEKAVAARLAEEQDYLLAAGAGQHPMARALGRLGARPVSTTWLRRERPYTVLTEGRFADLRELTLAVLADAKAKGDAWIERKGCETTFHARVEVETAPDDDPDSAIAALAEDMDRYRFVLTEGRFVSADGFTIANDAAVAVPDVLKKPEDGILTIALAWSDGSCASR